MTREEALEWFIERKKMNLDDKCQQAEDVAIKAIYAIDKIKMTWRITKTLFFAQMVKRESI